MGGKLWKCRRRAIARKKWYAEEGGLYAEIVTEKDQLAGKTNDEERL